MIISTVCPQIPQVKLDPNIAVFFIFLPPLLCRKGLLYKNYRWKELKEVGDLVGLPCLRKRLGWFS